MSVRDVPAVWQAVGPAEWPKAPDRMTFSALRDIEACPRRWALGSANYPDIWDQSGYPERIRVPTCVGSIVHRALERITRALAIAGCSSVQDPQAAGVLRELGGYTGIIATCTDEILTSQARNPRNQPVFEPNAQRIRSQAGHIRRQVQMLLARVRLQARPKVESSQDRDKHKRRPLGPGSHPEVFLSAPTLGWVGVADLINISETECEIVEIKTGEPRDEHPHQLQTYSLLWFRDAVLNPDARHATRLTLAYPGGDAEVLPPSPKELTAIERDLRDRTRAAVSDAVDSPPAARPTVDNCNHCNVKQLCDEYWLTSTQQQLARGANTNPSFVDLELTITGRHGPSSWNAVVRVSPTFSQGETVVWRVSPEMVPRLRDGQRVRVLDAVVAVAADEESGPHIVSSGLTSEVYYVASN